MKRPGLRRKGKAWYYDAGGKPRRWIPLGSNQEAAFHAYDRMRATRSPGTVGRMLQDYVMHLKAGGFGPRGRQIAPSTLQVYDVYHAHLHRVFGHLQPDELTQGDVLLYLVNCPRKTVRSEVALLSSAYRYAMLQRMVTFNPCIGAKLGTPRSQRDRYISHVEYDAIYRAAERPQLRLWLDLAYVLALRVDDCCRLRWDQFEDGSAVRTKKTGKRLRFTITEDLRAILDEAKALQGKVVSMYVIAGRGGRPVHKQTMWRWFREAAKLAGIEDVQPRDIRAKAGTDRDAEQEGAATALLGHEDARTTRAYLRGKRIRVVEPMRRRS